MKHVIPSNFRRSLYHRVPVQHASLTEFDIFSNNGERPDLYPRASFRTRRHHRLRVNFRRAHFADFSAWDSSARSTILHISVASAAS